MIIEIQRVCTKFIQKEFLILAVDLRETARPKRCVAEADLVGLQKETKLPVSEDYIPCLTFKNTSTAGKTVDNHEVG